MAASWADVSEWWTAEINGDPAVPEVVTPLLLEILRPQSGLRYLEQPHHEYEDPSGMTRLWACRRWLEQ